MTEQSIEQIEAEHGAPALVLRPSERVVAEQSRSDSIAYEYRLYLDSEASGGCILYGRYDRGWIVNPSARWVLAELVRERSQLLSATAPFAEAFEKVRKCHQPSDGHARPEAMREFLDRNECVPSGTNVGHWRRLADITVKQTVKHKESLSGSGQANSTPVED